MNRRALLLFALLLLLADCKKHRRPAPPRSAPSVPPSTYTTSEARYPDDIGYFNVKKSPYNCVGDGKADDTACIKKAMDDAMRGSIGGRYGTVYFPEGTYLVNDSLVWATYGNGDARVEAGVDTSKGCLTNLRITAQGSGYAPSSSSSLTNPGPAIFFESGGGGYGPSYIGRRTSSGGIDSFYSGLGNVGTTSCAGAGYKSVPKIVVQNWKAYLRFEGQSKTKSIIRLTDNNPKFQNANCKVSIYGDTQKIEWCRALILTGNEMSANSNSVGESAYIDDLWNLTFSTGSGNPGAVAVDWTGSNRASVKNVVIKSEDGKGRAGLSVARSSSAGTGPAYVKNVEISGFDYGIYANAAAHEVGNTFEFIDLHDINMAGVVNGGMPNWFRQISAWNMPGTVFQNTGDGGSLLVVDANLAAGSTTPPDPGPDPEPEPEPCPCNTPAAKVVATASYAITSNATHGVLFLRNIQTSGFAGALQGSTGNSIDEYSYPQQLSDSRKSINMTDIPNTPEHWKYPADNPGYWLRANCEPNSNNDASACIQAALDNAPGIAYVKFGKYKINSTLIVRNPNLRMFYGADSVLSNLNKSICSIKIANTGSQNFELRNWNFEQSTQSNSVCIDGAQQPSVTLADSLGGVNLTVRNSTSDLYIENWAMPNSNFSLGANQKVYARQYDIESGTQPHLVTTGGIWWLFGFKTEGAGNLIKISNGQLELLGIFSSTAGGPSSSPAFDNSNTVFSGSGLTLKSNGWNTMLREDGKNTPPNQVWVGSGHGTGSAHSAKQ